MEDRLPDLTLLLRRRWRSLTLGTAVGIVLAVFYVIGAQPKYESEALILVEQRDAALPIGGAQAAAAAPVDYAELLETHAAICSSERIVTAAIVAAKLDELQGIRAILRASPETTATDYIIEQIEAQPGAGSRTVAHTLEVSFVHTDADEAAAVLEAIVEQYRKFTDTRLRADFNEARKLIEKANVELEAEIESLQGELSRLRDDAPLLYEGTEAVNPHVQSLLQLQTLVLTTEQEYLAMASKLAQVEEILANGGLDDATMVEALSIVGNEVVERMALLLEADRGNSLSLTFQQEDPLREQKASAEFNQLLDLFVEERQLLRTYGEKSLEVERIRAQIDRVSDFIKQKTELLTSESDEPDAGPAELAAAYARILRYDISALDKTLSELRDKVDEERRLAGVAARFAMNESFLGEELERRTRLFDVIVQNLENVNLIGDYGGIVVEPLSSIRPGIQVWPLPILLLPLGAIAGGMVALVLVLFIELSDYTFTSREQVETDLGLPVIGIVDRVDNRFSRGIAVRAKVSSLLPVAYAPLSKPTEAIRTLRTFCEKRFNDREGAHVIVVTSATSGEGKSVTSANLAMLFARSDKKTLLIDGDMRRPMINRMLGNKVEPRLQEVLTGRTDPYESCAPTGHYGLDLLASSADSPLSSEAYSDDRFRECIDRLRAFYDVIVIDSPPVNGLSDALVICGVADQVILAVSIKRNHAVYAVDAVRSLRTFGIEPIGLAMHKIENLDFEDGVHTRTRKYYSDYNIPEPTLETSTG